MTLNGSCFQHVFQTYIKDYIPEFEEQSGMKVNLDLQAFPVYNQRMDLELSTKGSAYDFCNVTFIYTGRWIGAGWMAPLDHFIDDPNMTPADWDAEGFRQRRAELARRRQGHDLRLRLGGRRHDHGGRARRPASTRPASRCRPPSTS